MENFVILRKNPDYEPEKDKHAKVGPKEVRNNNV